MKYCFSVLLILLLSVGSKGQELAFFADVMINADDPSHRAFAAEKFDDGFNEALQKPNSFDDSFENLQWISIQYPSDSSFRIFSWQIESSEDEFLFYTILQDSQGNTFAVDGKRGRSNLGEGDIVSWSDWSGALIYGILPIGSEGEYTLLTYRQRDKYTKVKTIEVLYKENDEWVLGKPVFQIQEDRDEYKNREIMEYSADSPTNLTFVKESNRIVYDNLIAVMGRIPGQGPTQVADGSYKAYQYDNGRWTNIDKLFDQVLERPPRAGLNERSRDLFGRTKKN